MIGGGAVSKLHSDAAVEDAYLHSSTSDSQWEGKLGVGAPEVDNNRYSYTSWLAGSPPSCSLGHHCC